MKKADKEQGSWWPMSEPVDKTREELREELILQEELECARREAVTGLMAVLKVDPTNFCRLWIRPLMQAGATLDMALASIAQSCFQPN